jgi:hypothetical protein
MNTALVRCLGCNKVFTPQGLSQHVNKTQRAGCRTTDQLKQQAVGFRSGPLSVPTPASRSHEGSSATNMHVLDGNDNVPDYTRDLVDTEDANTFEILTRDGDGDFPLPTGLDPPNATLSSAPPPECSIATEAETPCSDELVVDRFPHGCPGAPVVTIHTADEETCLHCD